MLSLSVCLILQSPDIWIIAEDLTGSNEGELSLSKGQAVEVVDASPGGTTEDEEWCLVRTVNTDDTGPIVEGLVPMASLKPATNSRGSGCPDNYENEGK